jgi:hypothetical protein
MLTDLAVASRFSVGRAGKDRKVTEMHYCHGITGVTHGCKTRLAVRCYLLIKGL